MSTTPFRRAKQTVEVSVGESVRIVRDLQGLSQNQLAALTGIPQSTISSIENDRVNLGVERAKVLAGRSSAIPRSWCFPDENSPGMRQHRDAQVEICVGGVPWNGSMWIARWN